jgi:flagellin
MIMGLRINQNIAAMNAYRNLSVTDGQMSKSLEKLSSGYRINRAADDAAGLSISEGLRSQVGGLKVAVRNAQDGVNVAQTADGALNETTAILQRMRDLAVQASNGGSQDADAQAASDQEFQQLNSELTRISTSTKFGSQALLGGSYTGTFQVGSTAGETISMDLSSSNASLFGSSTITGFDATGLGLDTQDLTSTTNASAAITAVDNAIKGVSAARSYIGATQNRFEHTVNNINVAVENLSASESAIRDTDMASEMVSFTRSQILSQAGTAMLAQANTASQGVLRLLQ